MYYIRNWVYKSPNNNVDDELSKRGEGETKENVHCKVYQGVCDSGLVVREESLYMYVRCISGACGRVVIIRSKLV